jgi:hypothetical protein
MKYITLLLLCFFTSFVSAQKGSYQYHEDSSNTRKTIDGFLIPGAMKILATAKGDLNRDGIEDVAVVLQVFNNKNAAAGDSRRIYILLGNLDGRYSYIGQPPIDWTPTDNNPDMLDPFKSIDIKNNVLSISLQHIYRKGNLSDTSTTYKFRVQKGAFTLIGAELHIKKPNNKYIHYSYNMITYDREYTQGKGDTVKYRTIGTFYPDYPPKQMFSMPKPFTWEIEDGVFL